MASKQRAETPLCCYFLRGKCRFSTGCWFCHDWLQASPICNHGADCWYKGEHLSKWSEVQRQQRNLAANGPVAMLPHTEPWAPPVTAAQHGGSTVPQPALRHQQAKAAGGAPAAAEPLSGTPAVKGQPKQASERLTAFNGLGLTALNIGPANSDVALEGQGRSELRDSSDSDWDPWNSPADSASTDPYDDLVEPPNTRARATAAVQRAADGTPRKLVLTSTPGKSAATAQLQPPAANGGAGLLPAESVAKQAAGKRGASAKKKSSSSEQENVPASSKHAAATGKAAGGKKKVHALPLLSLPPGNVERLADPEGLHMLLQKPALMKNVLGICLGQDFDVRDEHLGTIVEYFGPQLRSLELGDSDTGDGSRLTAKAMLATVKACPNLQTLKLWSCPAATNAVMAAALQLEFLGELAITGHDRSQGKLTTACLKPLLDGKAIHLRKLYLTDQFIGFEQVLKLIKKRGKVLEIEAGETDKYCPGGCVYGNMGTPGGEVDFDYEWY